MEKSKKYYSGGKAILWFDQGCESDNEDELVLLTAIMHMLNGDSFIEKIIKEGFEIGIAVQIKKHGIVTKKELNT